MLVFEKVGEHQWIVKGGLHVINRRGGHYDVFHNGDNYSFSSLKNSKQFIINHADGAYDNF